MVVSISWLIFCYFFYLYLWKCRYLSLCFVDEVGRGGLYGVFRLVGGEIVLYKYFIDFLEDRKFCSCLGWWVFIFMFCSVVVIFFGLIKG